MDLAEAAAAALLTRGTPLPVLADAAAAALLTPAALPPMFADAAAAAVLAVAAVPPVLADAAAAAVLAAAPLWPCSYLFFPMAPRKSIVKSEPKEPALYCRTATRDNGLRKQP